MFARLLSFLLMAQFASLAHADLGTGVDADSMSSPEFEASDFSDGRGWDRGPGWDHGRGPGRGPGRGDGHRPPPPPPSYGRACFFQDTDFRGGAFCLNAGESLDNLANWGGWNDRISSFLTEGNVSVTVCWDAYFYNCVEVGPGRYSALWGLNGANWNDQISSIRVNPRRW